MTLWPTMTINSKLTLQYLMLQRCLIQCPMINYYTIQHYEIDGHIHSWIQSFLKGKSQSIVVDGDRFSTVTSGVPQCTVLGHLLFSLHISDLMENVQSQVRLFTDDCLLYQVIDTAASWPTSTPARPLSTGTVGPQVGHEIQRQQICCSSQPINSISMYQLGGVPLQVVDRAKYLVVNMSNNLFWSPYIANITAKANSKVGFLWRNLKHCLQAIMRAGIYCPCPLSTWVCLCCLGSPLTEGYNITQAGPTKSSKIYHRGFRLWKQCNQDD